MKSKIFLLTFIFLAVSQAFSAVSKAERTFRIDYDNDVFLMDGKPFQFVAGSFHYFRCPHQYWRQRLRTMRAAGLNVVTTYVEWSFHEPKYREYDWTGDKDLVKFIEIAQEEDLYVILRPGPYICAERDNGGFPYWLMTKYPDIKLRRSNEDYKNEVVIWYKELMPKMDPYLYENGGPIIMVQVENEYGFFLACDRPYMAWLAELTKEWVGDAAVLFTTDTPQEIALYCGSTPGAYTIVDFGENRNVTRAFGKMRKFSPKGPLVNSEFYPGWFTHWGEKAHTVSTASIVESMEEMFAHNASFNFYMFYGGTNFGFTAGANIQPNYRSDITSYDYDAPMTEAGDPTPKYMQIRESIAKHMPMPNLPIPLIRPKGSYGVQTMKPVLSLLGTEGRRRLGTAVRENDKPLTFEAMDQYSGLVLYETTIPSERPDPTKLVVNGLRDRALVYIDGNYSGLLSRGKMRKSLDITEVQGSNLQLLVENLGRLNSIIAEDFKGIRRDVTFNSEVVTNWKMTGFPLEDLKPLNDILKSEYAEKAPFKGDLIKGPVAYSTTFTLADDEPLDSYLDMTGWGKGVVWLNGRNLGRYWPGAGPQITLYTPGVYFSQNQEENTLVIIEFEKAPSSLTVEFINTAKLGYDKK